MVMSSLPSGSWWHYFQHLITVENLIMQVPWWASMKHLCVPFRWIFFCCLALESCIMVKTNVLWMITVSYVYKRIKNCQTRKWLYFVHYEFCWTRNLLYYYFPLFPFSSLPQGSKKVLSSSLGQFDFNT